MAELAWLGIVRHGESTGNVSASEAESGGLELVDIAERDADVPLSPTGRAQAGEVGRWLADLPDGRRPDVVVASPYLRTRQTAEIALGDLPVDLVLDERLRDRELGVLDLHTTHGVLTRLPEEAARRARLGKFYYRPPGGESWADVALRLRSLLGDLRREYGNCRVLLVSHEAVVYLLRYLLEGLTEAQLLRFAHDKGVANGSLSSWRSGPDGRMVLADFNRVDHLRHGNVPSTDEAEPV